MSPARSSGGTDMVKGVALLAVAVAVGLLVLQSVGGGTSPTGTASASTATTVPRSTAGTATPTTAPHTATTAAPHGAPTTAPSTTAPPSTGALRPPGQVTTLVANGTQTTGAAGRVQSLLQKSGYNVLAPTNSKAPASASSVYFANGYSREATAEAELLGLAPSSVLGMPSTPLVAALHGADVLVLVGPNLASSSGGS